jgi:TM2 domain-containing membrane protein YozV
MTTAKSKLIELARSGDPKAIEILLNHSLKKEGIQIKVGLKENCLKIMFESEDTPNELRLSRPVFNAIQKLHCKSIHKVKLYGKKQGDEFPDWMKEQIQFHTEKVDIPDIVLLDQPVAIREAKYLNKAFDEISNLKARTSVGISYVDFPPVLGIANQAVQRFQRSDEKETFQYCAELVEKIMKYYQMSLESLGLKVQRSSVASAMTFGLGGGLAGIDPNEPLGKQIKEELPRFQGFNALLMYDFDAVLSELWNRAWELTDELNAILEGSINSESLRGTSLKSSHVWMVPEESMATNPKPIKLGQNKAKAVDATFEKLNYRSRKRAAILAIFLGWLGIHKFYLKYTGQGLILLAIGISGMYIPYIGFSAFIFGCIEGLIFLTKNDEEFKEIYIKNRKGWL